ncbi:dentin sialophosphoprotein-like isoform X2 [Pseudomyrmex gracilis]|uniref:dentin sialophosphoprotein-like isoform X2 n=1 Tax=Pseudomyrmex gracilis TaxID=219809 RepID=UPI00099589B7|nr:dentin sialophosphoprotein-like isoform X2 [Pseudomyrmex gracilis]
MATFRNLIHNAWRGIKDIFDFKVPEDVVRVRETKWDDFFERYSKEASDEIDLNVDILEPEEEEEEEEEEESEEDHSFGQRLPMRTPTSLIQYWINTGNPPCKALLDKNALSESGSSLSEKEHSSLPNAKHENNRQKSKTDSSCSSVDTAVYILSNANVTKKADTIAIIAGAENVNSKLAETSSVEDVDTNSNAKTKYIKSAIGHVAHGNKNIDISSNDLCSLSTFIASTRIHDRLCSSSVDIKDSSDIQSKKTLSCKISDEVEVPSRKSAGTDDTERSIAQCIDKTSVSVANRKTSDGSATNKLSEDSLRENQTNVTNEEESPFSHRKKLYTGRDSPIDLLQTKVHSISRLSGVSHPALDPNDIVKKKISKNKSRSFFNEHFLKTVASKELAEPGKKKVRRKRSPVKNVADSGKKVTKPNKIQNSTDNSSKYPAESDNSDRHHSVTLSSQRHDTNVSTKELITNKPDLASVNLNPVVVLTRFGFCNESSKHVENNAGKSVNDKHSRNKITEKPFARGIEDLDGETIESDDNTILICECEKTSRNTLLSENCSKKSRVSNEIVTVQKMASENVRSSNSRDESEIEFRELRVVLERLLPSVVQKYAMKQSKVSRKDTVRPKEALKLPEVKVRLERLPVNVYRKRDDNIAEEQNLSDSSSPRDSERNRVPTRGNARKVMRAREVITDDQSGKLEESDETMRATDGIVDKRVNRLFDNAESDSALRYDANDTRTSQSKRRKYSILSTSSDETSLNESVQPSKKRSKISGKTTERSSRDKTAFDVFESKRIMRKDKRVRFSTSESNTSSPKVNGKYKKTSPFFGTDTTNSVSSDTTEMNGMRCKDDVGIVLFQTKTYETDSSDTEIYNLSVRKRFANRRIWKDSSSLSSADEKQRAANGTCNREISSSSSDEKKSHDDDSNIIDAREVQSASIPKKTSSDKEDDLVSRRKKLSDKSENAKISQRNNSVESTEAKLITFQTKTYYDSDSSE